MGNLTGHVPPTPASRQILMSVLRVIGYIGLSMLCAVVALSMYLSVSSGDYKGLFIGAGAMTLFAWMGNTLWVSGRREQVPFASVAPSRKLFLYLCFVLGIGAFVVSVERIMAGAWLSAIIASVVSLILLGEVYRAWSTKT